MVLYECVLQTFVFLIIACVCYQLTYKLALLFASVTQFVQMMRAGLRNRSISFNCTLECLWGVLVISFCVLLIYFWEVNHFDIYYAALAMVLYNFLWLCIYVLRKRITNHQSTSVAFKVVFRLVLCVISLQILFITLKWCKQIQWNWYQTFILTWLMLIFTGVIQICCLIDLSMKVGVYYRELDLTERHEIATQLIGVGWINLVIFGISGVGTISLVILCNTLEFNNLSFAQIALTVNVFYEILLIIYSTYYRDRLIEFCISIRDTQPQEISQDPAQPHILSPQGAQRQAIFSFQSPLRQNQPQVDIPKLFIRISSTYFLPDPNTLEMQEQIINAHHHPVSELDPGSRSHSIENQTPKRDDSATKYVRKQNLKTDIAIGKMVRQRNNSQPDEAEPVMYRLPLTISPEPKQCVVCFENIANTVFMPCLHGGLCSECAKDILEKKPLCIICRQHVQTAVKIHELEGDHRLCKVENIIEIVSRKK